MSEIKKKKILVAEDSPTQAAQIKQLLESHNYQVSVATDGEKAMEWLSKNKPSLVISDILMPELDGFELCKRIKLNITTSHIPVILLTQLSDYEEIIEGLSCGADSFITKPFNEDHLLLNIARLISDENYKFQRKVPGGIQILYKGEIRHIQAEQQNVINLLFSIYEGAVQQNKKLIQTQDELRSLNERLESIVEERTSDLTEEIKLSNQIAEKLKESEERWRTLVYTMPEYIGLVNCEGKFLFLNHYAEGFSEKDTIGKNHLEFIPDEWKEFYRQKFEKCISTQKNQIFEYTAFGDNNRLKTYETCLVPVIQQDKVSIVMAIARDITEHKLAEGKINNERRMLRTLIDNLPDVIYVKDVDCRKVIANIADVLNIGFKEEAEVLGKTDIELFPGQTGQRGYSDDKKVIDSGKALVEHEEDFIDSKGVRHWFLTTKIPLLDKDEKIIGLVGIGHDITKRKQTEEVLKQIHEFNASLLRTIPFAMNIVDETGTVLYQNDIFKIIFEEEGIGKKCWDLYKDDKMQCSNCPLINGITIGNTDTIESPGVLGKRVFEIIHTGMMYENKKAILEIFQDITEKKLAEEKLIKAKEKAEEGDRLKTAFLNNITHEIRTPMNAICGFSALLSEPGLDAQTQQSYIETITRSSDHLLAIISDIIDISNIEAGIVRISNDKLRINDSLKRLEDQFSLNAVEKGIILRKMTSLPDEEAIIVSDSTKFNQVLSNLLSNAFKFTKEGIIEFGYRPGKHFIEFYVSDTGIGIPDDQLTRIFERFYQVNHKISRFNEGTGLGLPISKAFIELMGGKIWVKSEPGRGSVFYFTLPYNRAAKIEVESSPIRQKFAFDKVYNILIAEDDNLNAQLMVTFLAVPGLKVTRVMNGAEAVEYCKSGKPPDLVLMDLKMPVMDGFEATMLIRERFPKLPIIAQSAYALSDEREKALASGCNDFITKPFQRDFLLSKISEHLPDKKSF